jgi:hypothetical protein
MNSHSPRSENNAGRIPIPLAIGAWVVGATLVALVSQRAITAFIGERHAPTLASVRDSDLSGHPLNPSRKASSLDIAFNDSLRPETESEFALGYEPVAPAQASSEPRTAAPQENRGDDSALTWQEQKQLASNIDYEANRLLRMLAEKYDLTPAQQAQVFSIIARATPAAAQFAAATGDSLTTESLSVLAVSIKPENWTYESAADPVSAATDSTLLAQNEPAEAAPTRTRSKLTSSPDVLSDPLDEIEPQLAPFLDPDQLAAMDEEQVDRLYWWGEILIQISGEIDDDAAIAAAALGSGTGTSSSSDSSASSAAAGDSSAVPAAHQDGTLFDLIGQP